MSRLKNRAGMTLVEIMIVLAIVGSIMAILIPNVVSNLDKSKVKETRIKMSQIVSALQMYYADCGKYPQALEGISKPDANCSNWGPDPYYKQSLKDGFNNDFIYELEGGEFSLKSLGKDRREGGAGNDKDITLEDLENNK